MGGSAGRADRIWTGGRITTMDPARPRAEAMAASGGRLIAVGSDADIAALAGPGTRVTALHGRAVLPGLVESHTHGLWGACRDHFEVFEGFSATLGQLLQGVRDRAAALPAGRVIRGGPWTLAMRPAMGDDPRALLDRVAPDHPVVLRDITQHAHWCNSAMLALAGIGEDAPDIPGGVIERRPDGSPNGILAEGATAPVHRAAAFSPAELAQAAEHMCGYLNRLGFTAFKEPMATEPDLAAYRAADDAGVLTLHMAAHIAQRGLSNPEGIPMEEMERLRRSYGGGKVRTDYAKLFLDGVAPGFTASFLDPYVAPGYDAAGHDPDATLLIARDDLADTVSDLDARGFTVKMHAVGDNAARAGLDAIAAARRRNGPSGLRHEIAHAAFVTPADIARFAALDAVAEVSPKLWFPNPVTAGQIALLGAERAQRCHPIRDLLQAGARVVYASDWPAAAPDANPWPGLAGMLTRRDPAGRFEGSVGADQAIALNEALPLFTVNGAMGLRMAGETGQLIAGAWADFIVLDRPLDEMTPEQIAAVEVRQTVHMGETVHEG